MFNTRARLPSGRAEIALLHYALDGRLLDRLPVSIDPERWLVASWARSEGFGGRSRLPAEV